MTQVLQPLAEALGEPVEQVRVALGEGWRHYPEDAEPIDSELPGAITFATGEPLEAFISIDPGFVAFIYNPQGRWVDPGTLVYTAARPGPPVPLGDPDTIEQLASRLQQVQRSARSSLRRCGTCERRVRREFWFGDGYCQACASTELGVVY